jgi:lipoprotein-anchoring transpeptidase ErfK/SrfK
MNYPLFRKGTRLVAAFFLAALTTSCTVDENGKVIWDPAATAVPEPAERLPNPESKYYSPKQHIWVNDAILDTVNSSNSRIKIDLSEQRARMYKVEGERSILAIETQISTGKGEHRTPTGSYRIMEKVIDKESNLYGKWVDPDTGSTIVSNGDSREPPEQENAEFRGTKMPYWMRLTSGGVGLHIGNVPNYPASHGCIRMPSQIQPLIYSKSRLGTRVEVTN